MDTKAKILDAVENGIFIVDPNLKIRFWNRWLAVHTGIRSDRARGNFLNALFPDVSFDLLKRKIDIALKLKSSTFTKSTVEKYIIPIELKKITKSIFKYMQQDCVITPISQKEISVAVYDASPLLEARSIINDQMKQLERQAKIDGLTQCYNKKMFNELLPREIKLADRHGYVLTLVIFDIDNFKLVNDTYGHLAGDHVLRKLAYLSQKTVRESDILARWGGEEFCLLLPQTDAIGGAVMAENLRYSIETYDFGKAGSQQCSFGVAQYLSGMAEEQLVANADKALYKAKNAGKNQVVVFKADTFGHDVSLITETADAEGE